MDIKIYENKDMDSNQKLDDELIQKASTLVGYESEKDFTKGLADVIEDEADGEDKFIASLILAKEIAGRMNGIAVLWYD